MQLHIPQSKLFEIKDDLRREKIKHYPFDHYGGYYRITLFPFKEARQETFITLKYNDYIIGEK